MWNVWERSHPYSASLNRPSTCATVSLFWTCCWCFDYIGLMYFIWAESQTEQRQTQSYRSFGLIIPMRGKYILTCSNLGNGLEEWGQMSYLQDKIMDAKCQLWHYYAICRLITNSIIILLYSRTGLLWDPGDSSLPLFDQWCWNSKRFPLWLLCICSWSTAGGAGSS